MWQPVEPKPEDDELLKRHNNRREVNWVPYGQRRSEGQLTIGDDGARVTVFMEVAGLGQLVIAATAKYSQALEQFIWNEKATLSARIDD